MMESEFQLREFRRSRGHRILLYLLNIALMALCIWCGYRFLTDEPNPLLLILVSVGFVLVVGGLIRVSQDRIVLGSDYIEVTEYFKTKRFYFTEIDGISPEWNCTRLRSKGRHIKIAQDYEGWKEISEILKNRLMHE